MTQSLPRGHWLFLGLFLYLTLLGLGLLSLRQNPPRPAPPPPPPAPARGGLYAQDGTPLALDLPSGRYYPLSPSASQLLGFGERATGRGLEGLEGDLDRALAQGQNFTLTLDPWVQALAERALWAGLDRSRAEFGSVVVLARDGRLLAVANGPPFDPNRPRQDPSRDIRWRNHAFLVPLEPGSTMKALSAAMLLEEGLASLATRVETPMRRQVDGWVIRDVIPHPPVLSLEEILHYSSNVGISLLIERLPKERFFQYMQELHLTDLEPIPGVRTASPKVTPPRTWSQVGYANHSFGQGFLVTPLHLAAAYGALVDGVYRPPLLFTGEEREGQRVFSEATAEQVRLALTRGLAPRAGLRGYPLAGKTGTAQVVVNGRYSQEVYTAWFAGFVPGDKPLATVMVSLYHPKGEVHGSQVAAPIFREVAAGLLAYWGIPPYAKER